jgi:hypothetical protein
LVSDAPFLDYCQFNWKNIKNARLVI